MKINQKKSVNNHAGGSLSKIVALTAVFFAGSLSLAHSYASGTSIENGLAIELTEKGQSTLFPMTLELMKLSPNSVESIHLNSFHYLSTQAIDLNLLPIRLQSQKMTLGNLRDLLQHWLTGFSLKNPLIEAFADNLGVSVKIDSLEINLDEEKTLAYLAHCQSNHESNLGAVVINLHSQISALSAQVSSVRARDLNNAFLGEFGIDDIKLSSQPHSQPVTLDAQIVLSLTSAGIPKIEITSLNTNFDEVSLALSYQSPLILPKVSVSINGQRYALNQNHLETELTKMKPKLVKSFQVFLANAIETRFSSELEKIANEKILASTLKALASTVKMTPIGAPKTNELAGPQENTELQLSAKLSELSLVNRDLRLASTVQIEDPLAPGEPAIEGHALHNHNSDTSTPIAQSPKPTRDNASDARVELKLAVINQLLAYSYNRGFLHQFSLDSQRDSTDPTDGGEELKLSGTPQFFAPPSSGELKLHVEIEKTVTGTQAIAVRNPLRFAVDLNISPKIADAPTEGNTARSLDFTVTAVDLDSLVVDQRSIRRKLFTNKVYQGIRRQLATSNQGLAQMPKSLGTGFSLPSSFKMLTLTPTSTETTSDALRINFAIKSAELSF